MKRSRPRRIILVVLLCLLAGAIVNVAVAWIASANGGPRTGSSGRTLPISAVKSELRWLMDRGLQTQDESRVRRFSIQRRASAFATESFVQLTEWHRNVGSDVDQGPQIPRTIAVTLESGWPCASMWGGDFDERAMSMDGQATGGSQRTNVMSVALETQSDLRRNRVRFLPLKPIWPGFAINTVFYAFIVWLLCFAPFALRRRMRIKRGLCPKCAYPVGTSEKCTECGAAVRPCDAAT